MGNDINTNAVKRPVDKSNAPVKKIALLDDFTNKSIYIDADDTPDLPHGEVVKRFIQEGAPNAKIEIFKMTASSDGSIRAADVNRALDKVLEQIDKGEKYDALNISAGNYLSFAEVSKELGKSITPANLEQNSGSIKQLLFKQNTGERGIQLKAEFDKIEKISSKGVPIYMAAGNQGRDYFNMYSLAKGVRSVGSLESNGKKADFSADNQLVTKWVQGVFNITETYDSKGKAGFDFTGDGSIDIYSNNCSSPRPPFTRDTSELWGTSFSSPKALAQDLNIKIKEE